ncbi:MAG TPA: STAS domain-containing protein [bacterium]|jgi:anti-sigma B factor antagonist
MTPRARVAVVSHSDYVVATVSGEIDLTNAGRIGVELHAAIPNAVHALVLDLSQTEYIDSRGVQLILDTAERLATRQQKLHLVVPGGSPLWRLFGIVSMAEVASIDRTVDDAVERVRAARSGRPQDG